jgi:hypothetical protein
MTTDDTDAKARAIAHGLIQGYIEHKVIDMKAFYAALVLEGLDKKETVIYERQKLSTTHPSPITNRCRGGSSRVSTDGHSSI